jgi:hypothetical protein
LLLTRTFQVPGSSCHSVQVPSSYPGSLIPISCPGQVHQTGKDTGMAGTDGRWKVGYGVRSTCYFLPLTPELGQGRARYWRKLCVCLPTEVLSTLPPSPQPPAADPGSLRSLVLVDFSYECS